MSLSLSLPFWAVDPIVAFIDAVVAVVVVGDGTMSAYVLFPLTPGQQGGMDGTIRHNMNRLKTEKHMGGPKSRYNSHERNVLMATVVLAVPVAIVIVVLFSVREGQAMSPGYLIAAPLPFSTPDTTSSVQNP